jgi:hypothetical protein
MDVNRFWMGTDFGNENNLEANRSWMRTDSGGLSREAELGCAEMSAQPPFTGDCNLFLTQKCAVH